MRVPLVGCLGVVVIDRHVHPERLQGMNIERHPNPPGRLLWARPRGLWMPRGNDSVPVNVPEVLADRHGLGAPLPLPDILRNDRPEERTGGARRHGNAPLKPLDQRVKLADGPGRASLCLLCRNSP